MNTQLEVNKVLSRKLLTTKHTQCLTVSIFHLSTNLELTSLSKMTGSTIQDVKTTHQEQTSSKQPCGPSSAFHDLVCGHTVRSGLAPCGTNCSTPGTSDPFLCWKCSIRANSYAADQELTQGRRPTELARADAWLEEFFAEFPDAYQEEDRPKTRREPKVGWQLRQAQQVLEQAGARSQFEQGKK